MDPGILEIKDVTKLFGSVTALDSVSASFAPAEIHAVLGENGAGKSTLVNILAGFVRPDSGSVTLDGNPIPLGNPQRCRALGVAMVHQHFTLVPEFTVAENIALAKLETTHGLLDTERLLESTKRLATDLGWQIPFNAKVRDLSVGVQQRVEILKSMDESATVVIFDEPTAVLSRDEVEEFFGVIRKLKGQRKTVILIGHKLKEVMSIADRVTILMRGKVVATAARAEVTEQVVAQWMVGDLPERVDAKTVGSVEPGLVATGLNVKGNRGEQAIRDLSFQIGSGEILGFGGVDGNGQVELAEALAGVRPAAGEMTWKGSKLDRSIVRIPYIPQDRQSDGLALGMSVEDNLLIEGHRRADLRSGPMLLLSAIRSWAEKLVQRFAIKVADINQPVADMSGGNQQKVVVGRCLDAEPNLLVAVNPARGLDIRATQYVHEQIRRARDAGAAVALISTDRDELHALSDRIVVLSRGQITSDQSAEAWVGGA